MSVSGPFGMPPVLSRPYIAPSIVLVSLRGETSSREMSPSAAHDSSPRAAIRARTAIDATPMLLSAKSLCRTTLTGNLPGKGRYDREGFSAVHEGSVGPQLRSACLGKECRRGCRALCQPERRGAQHASLRPRYRLWPGG